MDDILTVAQPVYRDPVHDFGILKFDPKAIKYMPVKALTLRPDEAKGKEFLDLYCVHHATFLLMYSPVGIEIRVVGNDAGEKLSILSGVISRLDRNAPEYGEGYSDFNTSYYQASAAASGGSSGSPVVNIDGYAVALQAGGRADGASTDYFLPLDRPLRALKCLQEGKPITRGDIQCQFLLKPFDECRRLGLSSDWEAQMRKQFPKETNMLVAEIVLPEGPSHGKIEEGDVLVKVNDELITEFTRLDDIMDSSVGKSIKLLLQRGGEDIEVEIEVGDLHSITPDRFVSVAGGSFHTLSYQQARLYGVACRGVYICESTGSFRFDNNDNGWLIQTLDHRRVPDLQTFIEVAKTIPDRARVVVTYKHLRDLHTLNTTIIYVDRHWSSKMKLAVRNDAVSALIASSPLLASYCVLLREASHVGIIAVEQSPTALFIVHPPWMTDYLGLPLLLPSIHPTNVTYPGHHLFDSQRLLTWRYTTGRVASGILRNWPTPYLPSLRSHAKAPLFSSSILHTRRSRSS